LRRLLRIARWAAGLLAAAAAALLVAVLVVPLPAGLAAGASPVVEYASGEVAHVFLSGDDKWRLPVDVARVDPKLVEALVALEDRRFFGHPGVDPLAVARAAWQNLRHGRRVSGGSTLTMQLARLLEPRPRTLRSKLVEMFRAVQLDLRLDKRALLAAYLARTPYGGNLEGVESAALAYFGHPAAHLTPAEIATLLAVPQGPARLAPSPANRERLRARRDRILEKLIAAGVFPADADREAPVPEAARPFPREARHAARWLAARGVRRAALDAGAQRIVERTLALAEPDLLRRGIGNAAVVVVDVATREVRALAGNLDGAPRGGELAMFDRPRSPGSTLKPLLYAMALDRGLALPGQLVADVPSRWGRYRPRNFDGRHAGLVTLREALARSLNLPFVELLARAGVEDFLGELRLLGARSPRVAPGHYGLSLVAGGIELTPLELAGMYATLAGGGRFAPLRLGAGEPAAWRVALGAGPAWLTRQALARPGGLHVKTGTSFGYRDAWAIGSGPAYTVVVWLGNVDNRATVELTGGDAAAPILLDLLAALERAPAGDPPPDDLGPVEVCAWSGHLAGDACPRRQSVLAPLRSLPASRCPYHRSFEVDVATGEAVAPGCRAGRATEARAFLVLPSHVTRWLEEQRLPVPPAPRFADGCAPPGLDRPLRILAPGEGTRVLLIPGLAAAHQEIELHAETGAESVSWFVDGELVRTAPARERVFWPPSPGAHEIVAVDAAGRTARREIEVR
jgi:penicillin-binding protein 1C